MQFEVNFKERFERESSVDSLRCKKHEIIYWNKKKKSFSINKNIVGKVTHQLRVLAPSSHLNTHATHKINSLSTENREQLKIRGKKHLLNHTQRDIHEAEEMLSRDIFRPTIWPSLRGVLEHLATSISQWTPGLPPRREVSIGRVVRGECARVLTC